MEIHIKTIPHNNQRYETVGDYFYDDLGVLQVRISDMGNTFYETLVAIHELTEELLTKHRGLTEQEIMDFDLYFEKKREMGMIDDVSEAGFSNEAPYLREHSLATAIEMQIVAMAGESWTDYDNTVSLL
jgi:hypothetical protein